MQQHFQVSGDLAALVRDYLEQHQLCDWSLYRQLQAVAANTRISFEDWWQILEQLQQRLPERHVALELGQCVRPAHLGVLGYLVLACENLGEALQAFQRYQGLLHDGDRAEAHSADGLMVLSWTKHYRLNHVLSDQVLVSGMSRFIRTMVGQPALKAARLMFAMPRPSWDISDYLELADEVLFDQETTGIAFPPQLLALPVVNHDPDLKKLLEAQAQSMLAILPQQDSLIEQLRPALLKALQRGQVTSAFVARELHLSERTLFRRLQSYGLSFKQLVLQTRIELAKQQLQAGQLTLAEIALLLGYSEQSAFNRAFKRETGLTPRQFQRRS